MPQEILSVEDFEKNVAAHEMQVIYEDGVNRHLKFKAPDTGNMYFGLITWPGYLCYYGDMGTYVFCRLQDMFEFFRAGDRGLYQIDHHYWAEKLQAVDQPGARRNDRGGGWRVYSSELFEAAVVSDFEEYCEYHSPSDKDALWSRVESDVLSVMFDGYDVAVGAAMEFEHENRLVFPDFYEHNLHELDHRFVWCCFALRWAIRQYDALSPASVEGGVA